MINRFKTFLVESTNEYEKKLVDPALMMFDDWYKVINPQNEYHDDSSYEKASTTIKIYDDEKTMKLINNINRNGFDFKVYEIIIDRAKESKYTKRTPDGNHMRDEKGALVYFTHDEVVEMLGKKRYNYQYVVFDSDKVPVAKTQDEFGALLVLASPKYKGFGLGNLVQELKRKKDPASDSGGFTPQGFNSVRKIYVASVKKYLASGMYSHLIKKGIITIGKVKDILAQEKYFDLNGNYDLHKLMDKPTKRKDVNLNPKNYKTLLMCDIKRPTHVIMYSSIVYEQTEHLDYSDHVDGFIISASNLAAVGSYDLPSFINTSFGEHEGQMIYTMLNMNFRDEPLGVRLQANQLKAFEKYARKSNIKYTTTKFDSKQTTVKLNAFNSTHAKAITQMAREESVYRKKHDPYDEMLYRIMEKAEV